ncbi:Family 2 glycosyl transferase [Gammaproteobacteria bacterium]
MSITSPVSVIIPVRNAATHLPVALESVLSQQPRPAEVIVIDGGSSDDSVAIAAAHGAHVIHQEGRGLAAARNQAIRASRHPWIAFCDGDDRWTSDSLVVRTQALIATPSASVAIGRVIRELLADTQASAAQREQVGRPVPGFTPGAMVAHRTTFEQIGFFDESLAIGADSDWFIRLQESDKPAVRIEIVVLYKGARGTSLSSDVGTYQRELLTVTRRYIRRRRENPAG